MRGLQDSNFPQFEREALIQTLCQHSEWPMRDVLRYIEQGGAHARTLGELTLRELAEGRASCGQRSRRVLAEAVEGEDFDLLMLEVLREVEAREVKAAYLRAQLGGPRWKIRGSLARLEAQGLVIRTGVTSNTAYRVAS